MINKFNNHFFDVVDNEHKAYWLGFLWSDAYLGYRIRDNGRKEYNLKLSLMENDYQHLEKLNKDINGTYNVHFYNYGKSAFCPTDKKEARLLITNQYFGSILRDTYGIIPHREDFTKIANSTPENLAKHLIRGIVDADGTFCKYNIIENNRSLNKYTFQVCGTISTLEYIESHLIKHELVNNTKRKYYKRHSEEDRDAGCKTFALSGRTQVTNVLDYLYKDASIYLDRKFDKYKTIIGGDAIAV